MVVRRIFGPKEEKITRGWMMKSFIIAYADVIRMIKSGG
jgi:hypothetical protein